jgi:hypothetical protein
VRIQTVDPWAFEMPDTPANEAGVLFIFVGAWWPDFLLLAGWNKLPL